MEPLASTGLTVRTAMSMDPDAVRAAQEVCEVVRRGNGAGPFDLAVVFIADDHAHHAQQIWRVLRDELAPETLIGVTAESVIGDGQEIEREPAVSLWCAALPGAQVRTFTAADVPTKPALDELSAFADAHSLDRTLRGIFFFADPFSVPVASVLDVLADLPKAIDGLDDCPVLGGMASAGRVPGQNALILNDSIMRSGGVGVALLGDVTVDALVSQGCRPIGSPQVVTKAKQNILIELAGRPPLEVVRDLVDGLPEHDRDLLNGGLHLGRVVNEYKPRFGRGDFLIRGLMGYDPESGAIAVADAVRVGQTVQFHLRDADTAAEDLQLLLEAQRLRGPAAGGLLFTCNGRGTRLFEVMNHDAQCVREALSITEAGTVEPPPMAGFFAAGEIGPVGNRSFVHGHTACLALIRPRLPGA